MFHTINQSPTPSTGHATTALAKKNNVVLRLANFLVEGGYFSEVNVCFLVKCHTKNSCDRNFNAMKKIYHKKNIYVKDQALDMLGDSKFVTMIDSDASFFLDMEESQKDLYRKCPSGTISKGHIFTVRTENPSCVIVKTRVTSEEEVMHYLAKGSKFKAKIQNSPASQLILYALDPERLTRFYQSDVESEDDSPPSASSSLHAPPITPMCDDFPSPPSSPTVEDNTILTVPRLDMAPADDEYLEDDVHDVLQKCDSMMNDSNIGVSMDLLNNDSNHLKLNTDSSAVPNAAVDHTSPQTPETPASAMPTAVVNPALPPTAEPPEIALDNPCSGPKSRKEVKQHLKRMMKELENDTVKMLSVKRKSRLPSMFY